MSANIFRLPDSGNAGAYRLYLRVARGAWIEAGRLGRFRLEPGYYLYVGSARRNLQQRIARHRAIASGVRRGGHWHIDALLAHRYVRLVATEAHPGGEECVISRAVARQSGVSVPIIGFGATDCHARCRAHLYCIPAVMAPCR
ncbi:MAG: GIY-YIG nuclease family protein [Gammaproteobacteria bacterium]